MTGMTKEDCKKEHYLLIRNLSFLRKYSTAFKPVKYHSNLFDVEEGGEYSYLRIFSGKEWYQYVDIFNHRGFEDDDGERFSQSWGIVNMATGDNAEFDTLEELKAYIEENYDKYGLCLA